MKENVESGYYPVLVRNDTVYWANVNMQTGDRKEAKEVSLSFRAAQWFVDGDHDSKGFEKGWFLIFASKRAFDELRRPRKFVPSYLVGKGWSSADDLSAETRNELLTLAMRKRQ